VSLIALAAVSWQEPAAALIVYKGQIVPAWPDIVGPALAHSSSANRAYAPGTGFFPRPTGTVKGLVLLVDFSDQAGAFSQQEISDWLNLEGYSEFGCNGSVRDFFHDMSNGIVDLQSTVSAYYRARNTKAYYEGGAGYERADELLNEVIAAADPDIDFSEYDNDGDGKTESISIVYAGPSVTWGQGLWPHSGWLGQQHDGVTVSRYQMTNMGDSLSLYVFSHETGHMLFGWPDLYGFGDYCLMGNYMDPTNPVPANDFFRADQGWIALTDITAMTNATFAASAGGTGYRYVNPARPEELFFWSNVQNTGRWGVLAGGGLLMLHYDGAIEGNNPPNPLELAVVQADGQKDLDATTWPSPGSDANDYFQAGYNAEFSSTTSPNSNWSDGSGSGLRVYAISAADDEMQFSVGDGSAGGSPATGGASSTGGAAAAAGTPADGGTATSGGAEPTGGLGSGGDSSTGGPESGGGPSAGGTGSGAIDSAGGTTGGGPSAGGNTETGGAATGGESSGASTGNGGTFTGDVANTGGVVAVGGSGGGIVAASGGTNPGGSTGASGTQTGGSGTGASPSSQAGALGDSGGTATVAGGPATAVSPAGGGDGGCTCSAPRRTPTPATGFLFSLGALAAILRFRHRRRRRTSRWLNNVFHAQRSGPASEDWAFNRPGR